MTRNMSKIKVSSGDLIYVPQGVKLLKYDKTKHAPINCATVENPQYMLVIETYKKPISRVGVYHEGTTWYVSTKDVYTLGDASEQVY